MKKNQFETVLNIFKVVKSFYEFEANVSHQKFETNKIMFAMKKQFSLQKQIFCALLLNRSKMFWLVLSNVLMKT